jgi:hypothetical protein
VITAETDGWTALRWAVLTRDGECLAAKLGAPDGCQNKFGWDQRSDDLTQLELDHIKEQAMMGRKAPDDEAHLVSMCAWHHRLGLAGATWATSHRRELRAYLAQRYPQVWT